MNVIWLRKPEPSEPMRYRRVKSDFGELLAVWHGDHLCRLAFVDDEADVQAVLDDVTSVWEVPVEEAGDRFQPLARLQEALAAWPREAPGLGPTLELIGTSFQQRVWQVLMRSPTGRCYTYGSIAERLGQPGAAQAVGAAVGANPIALLVPCHRVLPRSGGVGRYRWGADRKADILEAEHSGA
ncbi:methylated-DNA--[protein]-cysteine S-methyltransferase [Marinobacteraceae bacterium S3BR75-40.1]